MKVGGHDHGLTYFKVCISCFGESSKNINVFFKGKPNQTIGDVLSNITSEWNDVVVDKILVNKTETITTAADTPPDTPVEVLSAFGSKFVYLQLKKSG